MSATADLLPAVVFLSAAIVAVPFSKRFKLGAVLGYLLAGVIIGPSLLNLIKSPEAILTLSELGVVLLLFILGLELSPAKLWAMRRLLLGLGASQMLLATSVLTAVAMWLGQGFLAALIAGFGLALSSTAFSLQVLAENAELQSPHGRAAFGVLLFQDLLAVPVLALIPLLGVQQAQANQESIWLSVLKVLSAIIFVVAAGRYLLRPVFRMVAASKLPELFTAVSLLVVLGTAFLMQQVGLSMGLGAFIAGILLADSEYSHEVEGHIQPFKGLLLGLFFMAIGMTLDIGLIVERPTLVLGLVAALLALQLALVFGLGRLFGYGNREALLLAALLASGSEFAFVVFKQASDSKLISIELAALLNVSVALAMAATPLLVLGIRHLLQRLQPQPKRAFDRLDDLESTRVIIAGFGRVGQIPARVLAAQKIPFTVIDPSSEQVDFSRRFGSEAYYGDTSRPDTLRAAKIEQADVLVLALDDPELSIATARVAKRLNPTIKIIARARNRRHAHKLMDLGIDDAVRETLHSAMLMTHKVLCSLGFSESSATARMAQFEKIDAQALKDQYLFHNDEAALIQAASDYRSELERLFESDQHLHTQSAPGDPRS
jgi:glutathione-regulated potassium-efflux system protein KefB